MLLVLHTALDSGIDTQLASALMVTHLGLFFLWQPIWQREQRVDLPALAVTLVLVTAMLWLNWWTVFAWLVLLIGIVAGRSFSTRRERYVYMLSLAMLVSELLINCSAQLFLGKPLSGGIAQGFGIGFVDGAVSAARLGFDADAIGANDVVGHGAQDAARDVVVALELAGLRAQDDG